MKRADTLAAIAAIESDPSFIANFGEGADCRDLVAMIPDRAFSEDPSADRYWPDVYRNPEDLGSIVLRWTRGLGTYRSTTVAFTSHGYGGFYVEFDYDSRPHLPGPEIAWQHGDGWGPMANNLLANMAGARETIDSLFSAYFTDETK